MTQIPVIETMSPTVQICDYEIGVETEQHRCALLHLDMSSMAMMKKEGENRYHLTVKNDEGYHMLFNTEGKDITFTEARLDIYQCMFSLGYQRDPVHDVDGYEAFRPRPEVIDHFIKEAARVKAEAKKSFSDTFFTGPHPTSPETHLQSLGGISMSE